jgi:hypothetical protein
MGDAGNMGDSGNMGGAVGGGGAYFADRVDLPFATINDPDHPDTAIAAARVSTIGRFGRRWAAPWKVNALLAAFTDTKGWRQRQKLRADKTIADAGEDGLKLATWFELLGLPAAVTRIEDVGDQVDPGMERSRQQILIAAVDAEIEDLLLAAETERADALGEILTQSDSFVGDFLGLLDATPGGHPNTCVLIKAAVEIGGFTAQHFKQLNDRPRPSYVCPALKPPIEVPGHGAYPSGHATQANLVALCLQEAFAGTPQAAAVPAVRALARRIARNREIAGVHYRSDSEAGRELAHEVLRVFRGMPEFARGPRGRNNDTPPGLFAAVAAEWS